MKNRIHFLRRHELTWQLRPIEETIASGTAHGKIFQKVILAIIVIILIWASWFVIQAILVPIPAQTFEGVISNVAVIIFLLTVFYFNVGSFQAGVEMGYARYEKFETMGLENLYLIIIASGVGIGLFMIVLILLNFNKIHI